MQTVAEFRHSLRRSLQLPCSPLRIVLGFRAAVVAKQTVALLAACLVCTDRQAVDRLLEQLALGDDLLAHGVQFVPANRVRLFQLPLTKLSIFLATTRQHRD